MDAWIGITKIQGGPEEARNRHCHQRQRCLTRFQTRGRNCFLSGNGTTNLAVPYRRLPTFHPLMVFPLICRSTSAYCRLKGSVPRYVLPVGSTRSRQLTDYKGDNWRQQQKRERQGYNLPLHGGDSQPAHVSIHVSIPRRRTRPLATEMTGSCHGVVAQYASSCKLGAWPVVCPSKTSSQLPRAYVPEEYRAAMIRWCGRVASQSSNACLSRSTLSLSVCLFLPLSPSLSLPDWERALGRTRQGQS